MIGWRGMVAGALGLAALYVVVQDSSAGRVGGLLTGAGDAARRFLSPAVPAFAKPAGSSASTSGAATAVPVSTSTPTYPSPNLTGRIIAGQAEQTA